MYCPVCGDEYRPGFTVCADCDVALVEEPPPPPAPEGPSFDPATVPEVVCVYRTQGLDAEIVRSYLEAADVPCFVAGEGYSSAYPLTVGVIGERRIMVRKQDEERARELIAEALEGERAIETLPADDRDS